VEALLPIAVCNVCSIENPLVHIQATSWGVDR
jgi:hypothetical protein